MTILRKANAHKWGSEQPLQQDAGVSSLQSDIITQCRYAQPQPALCLHCHMQDRFQLPKNLHRVPKSCCNQYLPDAYCHALVIKSP